MPPSFLAAVRLRTKLGVIEGYVFWQQKQLHHSLMVGVGFGNKIMIIIATWAGNWEFWRNKNLDFGKCGPRSRTLQPVRGGGYEPVASLDAAEPMQRRTFWRFGFSKHPLHLLAVLGDQNFHGTFFWDFTSVRGSREFYLDRPIKLPKFTRHVVVCAEAFG